MAPSRALLRAMRLHFAQPVRPSFTNSFRTGRTLPSATIFSRTRCYSTGPEPPPDYLTEAELQIFNKIKEHLKPTKLEVQDISGGCGSMYALDIVSDQFKGLPVIKQHRLVNSVLADEMKKWHGVQLKTKAP